MRILGVVAAGFLGTSPLKQALLSVQIGPDFEKGNEKGNEKGIGNGKLTVMDCEFDGISISSWEQAVRLHWRMNSGRRLCQFGNGEVQKGNEQVSFVRVTRIMTKVNVWIWRIVISSWQVPNETIDFDCTPTATIAMIVEAHGAKIQTRQ